MTNLWLSIVYCEQLSHKLLPFTILSSVQRSEREKSTQSILWRLLCTTLNVLYGCYSSCNSIIHNHIFLCALLLFFFCFHRMNKIKQLCASSSYLFISQQCLSRLTFRCSFLPQHFSVIPLLFISIFFSFFFQISFSCSKLM